VCSNRAAAVGGMFSISLDFLEKRQMQHKYNKKIKHGKIKTNTNQINSKHNANREVELFFQSNSK